MAKEPETKPASAPSKPMFSLLDMRDQLIVTAFREILRWQMNKGPWADQKEIAADQAVQYADLVMRRRAEQTPVTVVAKGKKMIVGIDLAQPGTDVTVSPPEDAPREKPKSIAELVGDSAPPLQEV